QHSGGRGHEDRRQTQFTRLNNSLTHIQAFLATQYIHEVDQENCILGKEPHEHHDAHHALHVHAGDGQEQGGHHATECEWHREQHHQRIQETLELSSHHHVDQYDGHGDCHDEILLRFQLLFVLTTHDDSEAIRKRDASQLFLNHSHCIAKRHTALQAGIDVGD